MNEEDRENAQEGDQERSAADEAAAASIADSKDASAPSPDAASFHLANSVGRTHAPIRAGGASLLSNRHLAELTRTQRTLDTLMGGSTIRMLREMEEVRNLRPYAAEILSNIGSMATFQTHKEIERWAKPLRGLDIAHWAKVGRADPLKTFARLGQIQDHFSRNSIAQLGRLIGAGPKTFSELGSVINSLGRMSIEPPQAMSNLAHLVERNQAFEATTLKLATFAGAVEFDGASGAVGQDAFRALLGEWRTHTDLPAAFWRNPASRTDYYRDADVDDGLLDADNVELVEMLIESGVVEGERRSKSVTAVVQAGPVKVSIHASRARLGAYRAISAFEIALRAFVAAKIEAAVVAAGEDPRDWYKRRLPGDVLKRVRERREAARLAGEAPQPPIAYVDLGDFVDILTQNINWAIFEPVFHGRDALKVDLSRLNAIRRPIAHPRPIDPVMLAEATLVINRMMSMISLDGSWHPAWDDDEG